VREKTTFKTYHIAEFTGRLGVAPVPLYGIGNGWEPVADVRHGCLQIMCGMMCTSEELLQPEELLFEGQKDIWTMPSTSLRQRLNNHSDENDWWN
jgi:hypothetical protein